MAEATSAEGGGGAAGGGGGGEVITVQVDPAAAGQRLLQFARLQFGKLATGDSLPACPIERTRICVHITAPCVPQRTHPTPVCMARLASRNC